MSLRTRTGARVGVAALGMAVLSALPAGAQLPSASTAALGFAGNYTATARGYNAIAWNPANLVLSGNPQASLAFFPVTATAGLKPVTLGDLADWQDRWVPLTTRSDWMARIQANKGEQGDVGADLTFAAVQVGPVGFQLSTSAHGLADLNTDAAQLILFGNAPGAVPQNLNLRDSRINAVWTSTAALSYARAFAGKTPGSRFSVGAALKYTMGHVVAYGRDAGSSTTTDPLALEVTFPVITVDTAHLFNNGSGVGLDLGGAYEQGKLTVSGSLQNVFNAFRWRSHDLRYRAVQALWNKDTIQASSLDEQDMSAAPAALREELGDLRFKPVLMAGISYKVNRRLQVDGDLHERFGDGGMQYLPRTHLGVGAEYRVLSFVPLRAGAALVTGGTQFGGGLGVEMGTFTMGASVLRRADKLGSSTTTMLTLISSFPRS